MKAKYIKLALNKKKRASRGFLFISNFYTKTNFKAKRIYFHDSNIKKIDVKNKIHKSKIMIIPTKGKTEFFFIETKKKINIKKGELLIINKNIKFNLRALNSNFVILCNNISR